MEQTQTHCLGPQLCQASRKTLVNTRTYNPYTHCPALLGVSLGACFNTFLDQEEIVKIAM